jgi:hypothetical protein
MQSSARTLSVLSGTLLAGAWFVAETPSIAAVSPAPAVHRAVGVAWSTEDGHQYQVEATSDLRTWGPVGPVITGDGHTRVHYADAEHPGTFYRVQVLPGVSPKWFPGLQELLTDSAVIRGTGRTLQLRNLRLNSESVSFEDLVHANFEFDPATQSFQLGSYTVSRGVGVYLEPYFARDNGTEIRMTSGSTEYREETTYSRVTIPAAGLRLTTQLGVGQAPVFWFGGLSGDVYLRRIEDPQGETSETIVPATSGQINSAPLPVTMAGRHVWEIVPVGGNSVSTQFWFHNANRNPIQALGHGQRFSGRLEANREYFKYAINLARNQVLTASKPSLARLRLTLLTPKSTKAASFVGLPLSHRAAEAGTYYLFVDHADGARGVDFSGTITIGN